MSPPESGAINPLAYNKPTKAATALNQNSVVLIPFFGSFSSILFEFFKNSNYLVFDSTFSDDLKEKAVESCHSTAKEAATLAKNASVSNLILTHFSARYKDENVLLDEANTVHDSVIAAKDQLIVEIE